jgi:hypothetical protein
MRKHADSLKPNRPHAYALRLRTVLGLPGPVPQDAESDQVKNQGNGSEKERHKVQGEFTHGLAGNATGE